MRKIVNLSILLMLICALILSSCSIVQGTDGDKTEDQDTVDKLPDEEDKKTEEEEEGGTGEGGQKPDKPTAHTHDFVINEVVEPTEKRAGYIYKVCGSCSYKENKYLKPTAQTPDRPTETLSEFSLKSSEQALIDAKTVFDRVKSMGNADIFNMPMMSAAEYMVVHEFTLELIKDCATETEKARVIYEWIVDNIEYDYDYLMATVYQTFTDKKAVCFGFTALMHDMLAAADILSVYASGMTDSFSVDNLDYYYVFDPILAPTSVSHAWVLLYADGEVICCDPTWSDFYGSYDKGFDLSAEVISKTHLITNINALTVIPKDTDVRLYKDAYCLVGNRIFFISNGELGNPAPASVMQNSIEYNLIPYAMERESEHDMPGAVTANGFFRLFDRVDNSDESYWYYALPDGRSYQYSKVLSYAMSMNHLCGKNISVEKMEEFTLYDGLVYRAKGNDLLLFTSVGNDERITIPATVNGKAVKTVGPGAFKDNGVIREVVINDGVQEIAYDAFNGAVNLEKITLPSTLKRIGTNAFSDNLISEIVIPEGVTVIDQMAFSYQQNLRSITLPASYAPNTFMPICHYCPALEEIKVATGSIYTSVDGVLFADDGKTLIIYPPAKHGKTYTVPTGVTHIGMGAFTGCTLERVILPSTLVSIGESAFSQSASLSEIIIPESVTTIEPMAFNICDSLTVITIPDSVETIASAFQQCPNLKEVYIGKNCSNINQAFLMSPSIEKVIISTENKYFKVVDGAVYTADGKTLMYYPSGREGDVLYVPEGTENLGVYAFDDTELKVIVLPEGMKEISSIAFMFNNKLIALVLPSTLERMPALPVLANGGTVYCSFARDDVPSGVVIPGYVNAYYLGEWEFCDGEPKPII